MNISAPAPAKNPGSDNPGFGIWNRIHKVAEYRSHLDKDPDPQHGMYWVVYRYRYLSYSCKLYHNYIALYTGNGVNSVALLSLSEL